MDCDTARLFLQFTNPRGDDLGPAEADELHAHLEQCSACNAQATNARRLDAHLGRAMLAVPVPAGLKSRLLERLNPPAEPEPALRIAACESSSAEERGVIHRRWIRRATSIAAVAACLLILFWGGYAWWSKEQANKVDFEKVVEAANFGGHGQDSANDALRRMGARPCAPSFVEYAYLQNGWPTLAEVPGTSLKVPQFFFMNDTRTRLAIVYAIPQSPDRVSPAPTGGSGSRYKAAIRRENGYTYLILHDGDDWNWLKKEEPAE